MAISILATIFDLENYQKIPHFLTYWKMILSEGESCLIEPLGRETFFLEQGAIFTRIRAIFRKGKPTSKLDVRRTIRLKTTDSLKYLEGFCGRKGQRAQQSRVKSWIFLTKGIVENSRKRLHRFFELKGQSPNSTLNSIGKWNFHPFYKKKLIGKQPN